MSFPAPMKLNFASFKDIATLLTSLLTGGTIRRQYKISVSTQGDTGTPSVVDIQAVDASGNNLAGAHKVRVRVCNDGVFVDSTNATIAATAGGGASVVDTEQATKDLVFLSDANGRVRIDLTDAQAETVTLRLGPAPVGGVNANYEAELDVEHAAP